MPENGWLAAFLLLAALGLTTAARDEGGAPPPSLAPTGFAPITLHVACGELFNAPCGKVLPRIAGRIVPMGIDLRPVESGGAVDTVASVCQGQAAAAIAPADTLAQLARQPACLGRYDVVGRPLYPLYALLVVRADSSFRSFDDLASMGHATVAVGSDGARITLEALSRSNAAWQRAIAVTNDDASAAPGRLADGSIDGFFTLEALDGALLTQFRAGTDPHGQPLWRFIDIRPGAEVTRLGDGGGHCLYRLTALDFGGAWPVTTVSVDAVMILGRGFREAHARSGPLAPDALASAIDATRAGILADMKSPGDWRPAGTSCQ